MELKQSYIYTYALNNPLRFIDPSGYYPEDLYEEEARLTQGDGYGSGGGSWNPFAGFDPFTGKYDPYYRYNGFNDRFSGANMVGRFMKNPGPTGVHFDKQGNKYFSYQNPITGQDNAYYTDSEGKRVYSEGNSKYVWKSEPFYGSKWVPITVDGKTRFTQDFGVTGYKYYFEITSSSDVMATSADWNYIGLLSNIVGATSFTASGTQNVLGLTRVGSNLSYQLSGSKIFIHSSKLLKPLGYAGLYIGVPADIYLTATGQQPLSTTLLNTTVSYAAIRIGGWYGLGIAGMYTLGQFGYNMTMDGLGQGAIKPNPDMTRNLVPGLAPTPVIY